MGVRRWPAWTLAVSMLLWGLAAVGGSLGILGAPDGSTMGWDTDWLVHTPFSDWLVPGLLLLGVGLSSLAAGVLLARDLRRRTSEGWHWPAVLAVALAHVLWIAGEVAFLWGPVSGTDATTRQFFHVFWIVYVPWALLDLALALSPAVRTATSGPSAARLSTLGEPHNAG